MLAESGSCSSCKKKWGPKKGKQTGGGERKERRMRTMGGSSRPHPGITVIGIHGGKMQGLQTLRVPVRVVDGGLPEGIGVLVAAGLLVLCRANGIRDCGGGCNDSSLPACTPPPIFHVPSGMNLGLFYLWLLCILWPTILSPRGSGRSGDGI